MLYWLYMNFEEQASLLKRHAASGQNWLLYDAVKDLEDIALEGRMFGETTQGAMARFSIGRLFDKMSSLPPKLEVADQTTK